MIVENASNHHRINGKTSTSFDSNAAKQKEADYKRLSENTMKVCNVNVNLMENSLASR